MAVLMGPHQLKQKPINPKCINITHACARALLLHVRHKHAPAEKSPHQSDISPLFDLVSAGFREQIKAGPEGCSMGLILL